MIDIIRELHSTYAQALYKMGPFYITNFFQRMERAPLVGTRLRLEIEARPSRAQARLPRTSIRPRAGSTHGKHGRVFRRTHLADPTSETEKSESFLRSDRPDGTEKRTRTKIRS